MTNKCRWIESVNIDYGDYTCWPYWLSGCEPWHGDSDESILKGDCPYCGLPIEWREEHEKE